MVDEEEEEEEEIRGGRKYRLINLARDDKELAISTAKMKKKNKGVVVVVLW